MRFNRVSHRPANNISIGILDHRGNVGVKTHRDTGDGVIIACVDNTNFINADQTIFEGLTPFCATINGLGEACINVVIAQESGKLQIAIRGVVSLDMTEKGDPSAAFNVDGAYIARFEAQTEALRQSSAV